MFSINQQADLIEIITDGYDFQLNKVKIYGRSPQSYLVVN